MKREKGTVIIIAALFLGTVFLLGTYLLRIVLQENIISSSVKSANQAYYLAESGVNEVIWYLNNNNEWKDYFNSLDISGEGLTIEREDIGAGSYKATVYKLAPGYGEIVSVGKFPFSGKVARRKVKTSVFRGLESPTHDSGIFTGGPSENVEIAHTKLNIFDGNLFSNNNLQISGSSVVNVYNNLETEKLEGKIIVGNNINLQQDGVIGDYEVICTRDDCDSELCDSCPPEKTSSVIVDFDSTDGRSFKSRAIAKEENNECRVYCKKVNMDEYPCSSKCVFDWREFEDLLWEVGEGGVLRIDSDVTFIDGRLELRGARRLEVTGTLVVDHHISIGEREEWTRQGETHAGNSHIEVTAKDDNLASGILTKRNIDFGNYALQEDSFIEGVLYAGGKIEMVGASYKLDIIGSLIGRKISLSSLYEGLDIFFDNERVLHSLGYIVDGEIVVPIFSPVLQVDHWEELY